MTPERFGVIFIRFNDIFIKNDIDEVIRLLKDKIKSKDGTTFWRTKASNYQTFEKQVCSILEHTTKHSAIKGKTWKDYSIKKGVGVHSFSVTLNCLFRVIN